MFSQTYDWWELTSFQGMLLAAIMHARYCVCWGGTVEVRNPSQREVLRNMRGVDIGFSSGTTWTTLQAKPSAL